MEDVLQVYKRPHDSDYPVVCMDESNKQLVGEVREALPARPGSIRKVDDEYVRNGVAQVFMAVEPLAGKRVVRVTERRTKIDWAWFIRELVEDHYPEARKVILVMDNLNTHRISSLYEAFPPEQARKIIDRLEMHYTPKHGSWLNIAEIELSVLKRRCLDRRISRIGDMQREVAAWMADRNNREGRIDWHFTTSDARIKLKRLYPVVKPKF